MTEYGSTEPTFESHSVHLPNGGVLVLRVDRDGRPGTVHVEVEGDEALPFYGSGPDAKAATEHLLMAMREALADLERDVDRLGPWPTRQLRALRWLFAPPMSQGPDAGTSLRPLASASTRPTAAERPAA